MILFLDHSDEILPEDVRMGNEARVYTGNNASLISNWVKLITARTYFLCIVNLRRNDVLIIRKMEKGNENF